MAGLEIAYSLQSAYSLALILSRVPNQRVDLQRIVPIFPDQLMLRHQLLVIHYLSPAGFLQVPMVKVFHAPGELAHVPFAAYLSAGLSAAAVVLANHPLL